MSASRYSSPSVCALSLLPSCWADARRVIRSNPNTTTIATTTIDPDIKGPETPTLIHVGGNDERCPPAQSRILYRALNEYVNVPTELIVYPGEGHTLTKFRNRQAMMEWDLAWLNRHVLGRK